MHHALKSGLIVVGLALGASMAGCAATPTHESTGAYIDDAAITSKVKAALLADTGLKVFEIHVATVNNVVELSGFVDSPATIERATRIAANVPGVRSVRNDLQVK